MKFTKLPLNGASWADELLYTFDTEFAEPIDVIVDIINSDTREIIGQQRLRGVTTGSINIAPYIRSKARTLSRRLSDHLNAHSDEYPEYNPNANPLNRCSIDGDIIQIR